MTALGHAELMLPLRGTWRAEPSPARRVPSHGAHLCATHVHVQFMDSPDPFSARGLPVVFRGFRVFPGGGGAPVIIGLGIPGGGEVVEPI